jgi:hypothetical protein
MDGTFSKIASGGSILPPAGKYVWLNFPSCKSTTFLLWNIQALDQK